MPRLVEATPKYRRHKASGQAVVSIQGHDFYLGPWNSKASVVCNTRPSPSQAAWKQRACV